MGGGDLNMKKSWHPLLLKNQEQVWLKEKAALEEKKKLDQLRKEKEEERQMQELQRMQEEKTGRKRQDKLDWMYATPATGTTANSNDLEDYLLGKKRVDQVLIGDENQKVGAAHKNFIAVQNANNARDTAAKIREDPLFAIKQQEQAAYTQLMKNPLRLREMQERNGVAPNSKSAGKESKEERRARKEAKRRDKEERRADKGKHREEYDERMRSPSPSRSRSPQGYRYREREEDYRRRRSASPRRYEDDRRDHRRVAYRERDSHDNRHDSRRRSPTRSPPPPPPRGRPYPRSDESDEPRSRSNERRTYRATRSPPPAPRRPSPGPASRPSGPSSNSTAQDERAAKLAAMQSNAQSTHTERRERLTVLLEKEREQAEADERARAKSKGTGAFLSGESKKVFSGEGGLGERMRRGKIGMVGEAAA